MDLEILIVEDEPVSQAKLLAILEPHGRCTTAGSGESAMAIIQRRWMHKIRFDLVTLDIHLPGIDGRETLKRIRQWEKAAGIADDHQAKVVMMTSTADVGMVSTCLVSGCDDYIVKPFNPVLIAGKLERLGLFQRHEDTQTGDDPVETEVLSRLKGNRISIPPIPKIAFHLRELINDGADADAVIQVLSHDVALSARVIGVSNTPLYRGMKENRTIRQAVSWLGMRTTLQIVECVCNHSIYGIGRVKTDRLLHRMWEHALATAHAAALLESMLGIQTPEDLFTMGLLHDIGRPILLPILVDMQGNGWFRTRCDSDELEQIVERLHASTGAAILKQWGYSPAFVDIARYHETAEELLPPGAFEQERQVIRCADQLAISAGYQPGNDALQEKLGLIETVNQLGLTPDQIQSLMLQLIRKMEQIKGLLH